jgi:hypothetical protein
MINQMMGRVQRTGSLVLSPGCLIDTLLDHIERLSGFVLPGQADNPACCEAEIEARVEQLGA